MGWEQNVGGVLQWTHRKVHIEVGGTATAPTPRPTAGHSPYGGQLVLQHREVEHWHLGGLREGPHGAWRLLVPAKAHGAHQHCKVQALDLKVQKGETCQWCLRGRWEMHRCTPAQLGDPWGALCSPALLCFSQSGISLPRGMLRHQGSVQTLVHVHTPPAQTWLHTHLSLSTVILMAVET